MINLTKYAPCATIAKRQNRYKFDMVKTEFYKKKNYHINIHIEEEVVSYREKESVLI